MRRLLTFGLVILLVVVFALPLAGSGVFAAGDPFQVNSSSWYLDFPSGGTQTIPLIITNISGETRDFSISLWHDFYVYSDPDYSWIDPAWCTRISPSEQSLQSGEVMVANVEFSLPDELPDAKWITWVKISEGTLDKPIVIALRKGTAIPKYDYSITPGDYLLRVYGYGASVVVDDPTDPDAPPISIRNRTNTSCLFKAVVEDCPQQENSPKGITIISGDSALQHKPDEVGLYLTNLSADEVSSWFTFSATQDSPVEVIPRGYGRVTWALTIPDTLPDGEYLTKVVIDPVSDIEGAITKVGMKTNIAVLIRLSVHRHVSPTLGSQWYPLIGLGSFLILALCVFGGFKLLSRGKVSGSRTSCRSKEVDKGTSTWDRGGWR